MLVWALLFRALTHYDGSIRKALTNHFFHAPRPALASSGAALADRVGDFVADAVARGLRDPISMDEGVGACPCGANR